MRKAFVENLLNDRFPWISIDNDDCNRVFLSFTSVYRVGDFVRYHVKLNRRINEILSSFTHYGEKFIV